MTPSRKSEMVVLRFPREMLEPVERALAAGAEALRETDPFTAGQVEGFSGYMHFAAAIAERYPPRPLPEGVE